MTDMWHSEKSDDGILRVTIDRKDRPVNALSRSIMEELRELAQSRVSRTGWDGPVSRLPNGSLRN